jgi:hypothetical protein
MGLAALDQALENHTGVGASIHVVSEEDLDGPLLRKARKVLVDMEQQPVKQNPPGRANRQQRRCECRGEGSLWGWC